MQPHQGQPLRPLLDADDDLWLDAARQLYPVLSRAQAGVEDNCSVSAQFILAFIQQSNNCFDFCFILFLFSDSTVILMPGAQTESHGSNAGDHWP